MSLESPPPESLNGGSGAMNNLGEILSQVLPDEANNKPHGGVNPNQPNHAALSKTTSNDVSTTDRHILAFLSNSYFLIIMLLNQVK